MRPLRPCLGCGKLARGSRCDACRPRRPSPRDRRPDYTHAERTRRAETVREWIAEFGLWCPGWQVPPHHPDPAVNPLTADHIVAVRAGGAECGELTVLCRSCNSRKQHYAR